MAIEHTLLLTREALPALPASTDLIHASARRETEPARSWHAEDCGIRNNCYVHFRLDKLRLTEAEAIFLALVGDVLRQADDDALLLAHGELPVLRRTSGRLVLSSRSPWLAPERIALLGLPAEVEDLGGVM
jgi:hypothetical protein